MDYTTKMALRLPQGDELWDFGNYNFNFEKLDDFFGTVICTSVTRPSTPFPGMMIYETDSRFTYVRNAANNAWIQMGQIPSISSTASILAPYTGQIVFVTTGNVFMRYTGSTWTPQSLFTHSANNTVSASESSSSGSFADLTTVGPSVTLTSVGTQALVMWRAQVFSNVVSASYNPPATCYMGFTISGATTRAASDSDSMAAACTNASGGFQLSGMQLVTISAGTNTYKSVYRVVSNTGTWAARRLWVIAP